MPQVSVLVLVRLRLANAKQVERIRTWSALTKSTFKYAAVCFDQCVFFLLINCINR